MGNRKLVAIAVFAIALVTLLIFVFTGKIVLPQSFSLGPITIRFYGIMLALATVAGFYYALRRAGQYGVSREEAEDLLFWLVVGGFIGARIYHIISSFGYYAEHPFQMVQIWKGGLSIYGVVIAGVAILAGYAWKHGKNVNGFLCFADWLVPSLLLGQIIGRLGNFFNYELYGYPTNLPWKMFVPVGFRDVTYQDSSYFHPLFLYEMVWNLFSLLFLRYWQRKRGGRNINGQLFFFYLLLYNIGRFFLEFLRIDSVFYGSLRVNAVVSLMLVICAGVGLLLRMPHDVKP